MPRTKASKAAVVLEFFRDETYEVAQTVYELAGAVILARKPKGTRAASPAQETVTNGSGAPAPARRRGRPPLGVSATPPEAPDVKPLGT